MNAPTFTKFPKLSAGNNCEGSDVMLDGVRLGSIVREIEWTDVGSVSVSYRSEVTGYRVELRHEEAEPVFGTLAEARAYARKHAADCFAAVSK